MRPISNSQSRTDRRFSSIFGASAALVLAATASAWSGGAIVKGDILLPDRGLEAEARRRDTVIAIRPEAEASGIGGGKAGDAGKIEIRSDGFSPRVIAVPVGATVDVVNRDDQVHNPVSSSAAKKFDLGMIAKDETGRVTFDRAGVVRVVSKAAPSMEAFIVVVDAPYFATPGASAGYEVSGLPIGAYVASAWSPFYEPVERRFTVAHEREVVRVDLRFETERRSSAP